LLVRAPAKINLSLLVAGKRPDGYHELETIMAKIDWYDEILIEPRVSGGIELVRRDSLGTGAPIISYGAADRYRRAGRHIRLT
jgi:4-diphosphocytidyl-2C-methyl-D-erythritol kinase